MSENELEVRREVTLHAGRDEVWEALTDPEVAERWLADEVELDAREGGEVRFRYGDGEERRGRVEEAVHEERLRIRWRRGSRGEGEVEFVLVDAAEGTRLVVVESARTHGPVVSAGRWEERLFRLELVALARVSAARAFA